MGKGSGGDGGNFSKEGQNMAKPWRESKEFGVYDIAPGPSWGTVIIDGVIETVNGLTYYRSTHEGTGLEGIRICDGPFTVTIHPARYDWIGEELPENLRGKWVIRSARYH